MWVALFELIIWHSDKLLQFLTISLKERHLKIIIYASWSHSNSQIIDPLLVDGTVAFLNSEETFKLAIQYQWCMQRPSEECVCVSLWDLHMV